MLQLLELPRKLLLLLLLVGQPAFHLLEFSLQYCYVALQPVSLQLELQLALLRLTNAPAWCCTPQVSLV
jgi:hypothetical protein